MNEYMHLIGAEQVERAANRMVEAAQQHQQAANQIEYAVERLERLWQEVQAQLEQPTKGEQG